MLIYFALLLTLGQDFRVINIQKLSYPQEDQIVAVPQIMMTHESSVYVADEACDLWFFKYGETQLKHAGGKGRDPFSLFPPIRTFFSNTGQVHIIHGFGAFESKIDGGKLEQIRRGKPSVYTTDNIEIAYRSINDDTIKPGIVAIKTSSGIEEITHCDDEEERISYVNGFLTVASDKHVFICNRQSIKRTIHWVLINAQSGGLLGKGSTPMFDRRNLYQYRQSLEILSERGTFPILEGASYSKDHGFTMTEYTGDFAEYTVIHCFNPETQKSKAMNVDFGKHGRLSHFLHLKGNKWLAYDQDDLVIVDLEPTNNP